MAGDQWNMVGIEKKKIWEFLIIEKARWQWTQNERTIFILKTLTFQWYQICVSYYNNMANCS